MAKSDAEGNGSHRSTGGARVVVGVDGSEASKRALAWALEEARLRHASLQVVHAWQFPYEMAAASFAVPAPAGEMELWAKDVLDQALTDVEADETVSVVRRAEYGPAASVLMDAARHAELLVVGTRGHGRATGLFLGSVSQYLAVHAPCPVLVVHGPRPVAEECTEDTGASSTPWVRTLKEIPEEECLALLSSRSVGRLVVVHDGVPRVFPVNYVLDGHTVALRTDPGIKLDWATMGRVAFEVDAIDEERHRGWSVVVHGVGRDITDGIDTWSEKMRSQQLPPWVGGERLHWVAIASPSITGRRICVGDESDLPIGA